MIKVINYSPIRPGMLVQALPCVYNQCGGCGLPQKVHTVVAIHRKFCELILDEPRDMRYSLWHFRGVDTPLLTINENTHYHDDDLTDRSAYRAVRRAEHEIGDEDEEEV